MKRSLDSLKFALPITLVGALIGVNRRGVGDLDSWWHVRIGDQIRAGVPFNDLGKSWSLHAGNWHTSQWLSEVLMSMLHQALGWQGLLWWRFVFGVLLLAVFVTTLTRRYSVPTVVLTSVISAFVLVPAIQERPALIGLIFITILGASCAKILLDKAQVRSNWFWVPACALWANLHGSWILAPAALTFAFALELAKVRTRKYAVETLLLAISVSVAGCLTPIGWNGFLLPLKLKSTAGSFITEWQPTTLTDPLIYGLLILLTLLILLWTIGGRHPAFTEVIWVLLWTIFAFTAFRNIAPATLLIVPIVAYRFDEWITASQTFERSAKQTLLTIPFIISIVAVLIFGAISTSMVDPLKEVTPRYIAARLSHAKMDVRIINDYNASGVLLALGGKRIHLAVDGRADRFDPNWLARYFSMLKVPNTNLYLLDEIHPNAAVLDQGSPLIWWLAENRHWHRIMNDGRYVLLTSPALNLSR